MSNEEIAVLIQHGDGERVLELWGQVRRFAYKQAKRWVAAIGVRGGVDVDDLLQASFLALLDALRAWEPGAGSFIGLYALRLKTAFSVACGVRSRKRDPLHGAVSLDMPIGEDEDTALGDMVQDPAADADMLSVEERDRLEGLKTALEWALSQIPSELAATIRREYFDGERTDPNTRARALRALRNPRISKELKKYR